MKLTYQTIRKFLENRHHFEVFLESNALVWIDHREYDEDIIIYFNEKMENKLEFEHIANGKPYGDDICLKYRDTSLIIPYKESMDRDTMIKE